VNITGASMALSLPVMNVRYVTAYNSMLDARSDRVVALHNDVLRPSLRQLNTRFSQGVARVSAWRPVFLKGTK
jgi:hypothetical protein